MSFTPEHWSDFITSGSIIRIDADRYLIGWGRRSRFEKMPDSIGPLFYFPDFFLSHAAPWIQHEHAAIVHYDDLMSCTPSDFSSPRLTWKNPYFDHFQKTFEELKTLFSAGSLRKAVPYVFEESDASISRTKLISALTKILSFARSQPLQIYGCWDEKEGLLGASPEILFKYSDEGFGLLETAAVAGTTNNEYTPSNLLDDSKEVFEHQVVVEGIVESLSLFGSVKAGQMQLLPLPKLSHLMTPIHLEMREKIDFLSIVHALHPTPALGAFPRKEGMKWLRSYQQKIPRERYGAPVGYILDGGKQAKCIVGIRNIQWTPKGSQIGAGCGVVPDSFLEKEWQEINLKISSIKEMMSL